MIYRNALILIVTIKFVIITNFNRTNTFTTFQTCYAKKINANYNFDQFKNVSSTKRLKKFILIHKKNRRNNYR